MGGLTHAVHWWEESQLRVLVLTSTVIQFFLALFPFLRRQAIPGWFRFIMWLAYHGGDAVAIYGLATLFNHHKGEGDGSVGGGGGSKLLQVVWAPVLLIHLGGSDGVTAYNIEDNELWTRHLLTAVSQVTVAVYVFCKSWPPGGDKRLLTAAILLFTHGIVKCFVKALAFKKASIYSLVTAAKNETNNGSMLYKQLEEYVRRARDIQQPPEDCQVMEEEDQQPPEDRQVMEEEDPGTQHGGERARFEFSSKRARFEDVLDTSKLFVDLSSPYHRRIRIFQNFSRLTEKEAYNFLESWLASAFLILYSKVRTATADKAPVYFKTLMKQQPCRIVVLLIIRLFVFLRTMVLPWASITLFHLSPRGAYNGIDVKITYAILCCTAVLESYATTFFEVVTDDPEMWPQTVAQYSVAGYFVRNKKHSMKMGIVSFLQCKSFVDQLWCMKPCFSSAWITSMILQYLKDGWKHKIQDTASYHCFNNHNSHWGMKMNMPFDECVLLWHLATDFCFFSSSSFPKHKCAFAKRPKEHTPGPESTVGPCEGFALYILGEINSRPGCKQESSVCKAVQCRQMSNYMVYLLFVNPEMLLPGSRRNLFKMAYDELNDILRDLDQKGNLKDKLMNDEATVMGRLIEVMQDKASQEESSNEVIVRDTVITVMQEKSERSSQGESSMKCSNIEKSFIHKAWDLAERLLEKDEMDRWKEIQDVWVQMLCFSASRCRGYIHAKALGKGGEFLSFVWLLLFYMGMETFSERLQRELLPISTTPPPTSEVCTCGVTASSASEVHTHAGAAAAPSTSEICLAKDNDMVL